MPLTSVPVEEFTTPDPVTASERMTIDELQRLMERHGIRHLPVVRGDAVVGVLSDRDVRLLYGLSAAEKLQVRAADIMSPAPLTVSAATPLDEVAFAMSEQKVGSVIVNDEDGRFLGIFTAIDALNALDVDFRTVIILCDLEGFKYEEMAKILDIPIGTVRSRLHRARNLLKEKLSEYAKEMGYKNTAS